jgi:hypothetical protein
MAKYTKLDPPRLVEYLGDRDKRISPHGIRVFFKETPEFGGRRVAEVDDERVFEFCMERDTIFVIPNDLERNRKMSGVKAFIKDNAVEFCALLAPFIAPMVAKELAEQSAEALSGKKRPAKKVVKK